MGFLAWIVIGFFAGMLAKWLMPGKDGGGFIMTTLLGVAGAFTGGWLGSFMGLGSTDSFSLATLFTATVGALVLLAIYRMVKK